MNRRPSRRHPRPAPERGRGRVERVAGPLLLLLVAAAPAPAGDRPRVVPGRDVDMVYDVPTPDNGPPLEQRMRFDAARRLQRIDPPGNGMFTITDYAARTMEVVQPARHVATIIPAPGPPLSADGLAGAGTWRQVGTATVAGLSCTDWQTDDASGNPSTVCFTADGVLLRARQQGRTILQARAVSEAPLDASAFVLPPSIALRRPTPVASPPPP